jgi:hypothetical protein
MKKENILRKEKRNARGRLRRRRWTRLRTFSRKGK